MRFALDDGNFYLDTLSFENGDLADEKKRKATLKKKPDCVLIDDDPLIHMAWRMYAERKKRSLDVFSSAQSFLDACGDYEPDTLICVDSDLGSPMRGEKIAKDLFERGFKKIYLTTGHDSGNFEAMPWLVQIVGKDPFF